MLQQDPEKREALRMGLLNAGVSMMTNQNPGFLQSLGGGVGQGSSAYQQMLAENKKKAEDAARINTMRAAIQAGTRPAMPPRLGAATLSPYANPQQAAAAFDPADELAAAMASEANPNLPYSAPANPVEAGQAGGFDPRAAGAYLAQNTDDPEQMAAALKMMDVRNKETEQTSEMKNWQFAQGLPEDQRAQFNQKATSTPSSIQEWQAYQAMSPQDRAQFIEMKRAAQVVNLGGTQAVLAPGGGIRESYTVTPKITDTPSYQAAQEGAKVSARETVQRGAAATSDLPKVQANADNVRSMVQGVLNHPGFSSTVGVTSMPGARFVPGTKEADFMSRIDQLKGSAFLQAFETLKGGGQITEVEGKKATDAINRMSISTSETEFRAAAQDFLSVVDRAEQNAQRAAGAQAYGKKPGGVLSRSEILEEELRNAEAAGDTENAALIRAEMKRMGFKAKTPSSAKDLPSKAPKGVDPELWKYATPAERKAWMK